MICASELETIKGHGGHTGTVTTIHQSPPEIVGKIGAAYLGANGDLDETVQTITETYAWVDKDKVRQVLLILAKAISLKSPRSRRVRQVIQPGNSFHPFRSVLCRHGTTQTLSRRSHLKIPFLRRRSPDLLRPNRTETCSSFGLSEKHSSSAG